MTCPFDHGGRGGLSRRNLLAGGGGLLASAGVGMVARAATQDPPPGAAVREPFFGNIRPASQRRNRRIAISSLSTSSPKTRDEVIAMLRAWSEAAARMTSGDTARPMGQDPSAVASDGGAALGLAPARLTFTFGFGAGLFSKDGADRYGLARKRPEALVELPKFNGDQLHAGAHRRRHFGAGLRRRSARRVSRFARTRSARPMARRRYAGRRPVFCRKPPPAKRRAI